MIAKADAGDFKGRFREIISDPLNLLIERVPEAGTVEGKLVRLHNGHLVPIRGRYAYYGDFSDILIYNRGVHEPLEEYIFQEVLKRLPETVRMVELGAYWGHYSMWLKKARPNARVIMVEPSRRGLKAGQENFRRNGYDGEFIRDFVGAGRLGIDQLMRIKGLDRLEVLHSDIQGFEVEMLDSARESLDAKVFDTIFVSTHGEQLHDGVTARLTSAGYRIEASSNYETGTTSFDGLIFASHPDKPPVLQSYEEVGRVDILRMAPRAHIHRLAKMAPS